MRPEGIARRIWYGEDVGSRIARAALMPAERVYAGISGLRGILYDAGWLRSETPALPTISVGNLSVGGTGKTPVAAWLVGCLREQGGSPAVVLRGYGGDEPRVHELLNPGAIVVVSPDRVSGVEIAAARGADVAVLDDAFQHRRVKRNADVVLVSADLWTPSIRLLPAGPWREPLDAVRRANVVVVTRKAATDAVVERVHERLSSIAPTVPRVSVRLEPYELVSFAGADVVRQPIASVTGRAVHVITGIGDPEAFAAQLRALGAVVSLTSYPDHHDFRSAEVDEFVASLPSDALAVCTLKDAVKVGAVWPRHAPLPWYVSQRVIVERGVGGIERVLDDALRSRRA